MYIAQLISSLAFCALSLSIHAHTLADAIVAARHYDPQLAAATSEQLASAEKRIQGRAQLLPRLTLNSRYGVDPNRNNPYQAQGGGRGGLDANLSLRQPLFDLPRIARYQRGHALSDEGLAALSVTHQKLVLETAGTYLDVLAARKNLNTAQTSAASLERQLGKVSSEAELGISNQVDVHEARAAYDEAVAERMSALHTLHDRKRHFERLTGLNASGVQGRFDAIPGDHDDVVDDKAHGGITAQTNPALQRSLLDVRIAETQLSEMRGRHLPTVELYAQQQYRDRSQGTFFADSNEHRSSFGVELNWEIFVGGEVQSQVREAELKLTSQREKAEALRLSIDSEIKKHLLAVDLGKHRIQANLQRTLSAQRKLEATRDGRELGIRSNLDILKAEKDSSDAKRGLAEAYHTYYQARLHLALEQGCLNDRVIGVLSAALDVSDDSTTTSRAG